ncbi:MAG TPA: DNA-processing protein DprA [Dongiaceae bacterium]|nr:DNA-processing protein DprA [Dongiaceae bacterium]
MGAPNPVTLEDLILLAHAHAPLASDAPSPAALARTLERLCVRALPREHPEYPAGWRDLTDAPPVCFARGAATPRVAEAVAIVGSRAASGYGLAVARRLAEDLARAGITVVSGLARGIDGAAHEGALAAGGGTVAVLPSGIDTIEPVHHTALALRIVARGSLVSERASGPAGQRWGFVRRNRLIAAMTAVTVVVEASRTSGALHTARAAKRLGRVVMAVPGDVERETALGCVDLLRDGARPCVAAVDVLRALAAGGAAPRPQGARRRVPRPGSAGIPSPAAPVEATPIRRVRAALGREPRDVEKVATAAGLPLAETLAHLLALEWSGAARRVPGGRWCAGT